MASCMRGHTCIIRHFPQARPKLTGDPIMDAILGDDPVEAEVRAIMCMENPYRPRHSFSSPRYYPPRPAPPPRGCA
jgi:hypothetical protein